MCSLNFTTEYRSNAEHMSPSGIVPFVQVGPFSVSEFDPIVTFVNTKGHNLSSDLNDVQRAEMKAYIALIENVLGNAEQFLSWAEASNANDVSKPRYGSVFPWPLNMILPWRKQLAEKQRLKALGWLEKSYEQVCNEVKTCCSALAEKLGEQDFFFGNNPTELDAVMFGHIFTLLTAELPSPRMAEIISQFVTLNAFCQRVEERYFAANPGVLSDLLPMKQSHFA
ncbi:metaxin-2-like isoform X2 [Tubulanus polymorphus]